MRANNQGGSLAGFIIVGVLLALVLVGGLYGLNRYNAERAATESSEQEPKKEEVATNDKPVVEEEVPVEEEKPAETKEEKPAPTPAPATPADPATSSTPSTPPAAPSTPTPTPTTTTTDDNDVAGNLPQTGPADTMFSVAAVASLAFAGTHYVRSRKHSR